MSGKTLRVAVVIWAVIMFALGVYAASNTGEDKPVELVVVVETAPPVEPTPTPTPTVTPTPQPTPVIENYDYVTRVVMQESGNQSLEGQMAVAQCIATTAEIEGKSLYEVVTTPGQYAPAYPGQPSKSVLEACERVFINGERVVDADIRWFYNPAYCTSSWHESQTYVTTIGDHRFFA